MKKLILALIAGATVMGSAQAEGPYVGLGVATSKYDFGASNDGHKISAKIFGGYEFDKTFGIEGGYTNFRGLSHVSGNTSRLDSDRKSYYVAGKASMPLNEQFSLFGKLGAAHNKYEQSGTTSGVAFNRDDSKTEVYAAIGGQYELSKQVALTLELERYGKNPQVGSKSNVLTAAARYSF